MRKGNIPELVVTWGFVPFKSLLYDWCREHNIRVAHGELGWFPHYDSFHLDPDGFCWDSILTRQKFISGMAPCLNAEAYKVLAAPRPVKLPSEIKQPFALWACQLITDKVNTMGLNMTDWTPMVKHFRSFLPPDIQLVVRPHPKMISRQSQEHIPYLKLKAAVASLPNTIMLSEGGIDDLIQESVCVAGANSTVLIEASLRYNKPTYGYGRSWFTNHPNIVTPVNIENKENIPQHQAASAPQKIWFINELLQKQINREPEPSVEALNKWINRNSAVPGKAIPRLAHFVWLGGDMPEVYRQCVQDFIKLNPDIPVKVWKDLPDGVSKNIKAKYLQARKPQQKADILRAWALYEYGGVYLDCDTAFIRPLPDRMFWHGAFCSSNHRTPYENGYMGCRPQCPNMGTYLAHILDQAPSDLMDCFGPSLLRKLQTSWRTQFKVLPWWWFNVARCERQVYDQFIDMTIPERQKITAEYSAIQALRDFDGQLPVGQHLHGSVNNQYSSRNQP